METNIVTFITDSYDKLITDFLLLNDSLSGVVK